MAIAHTPAHESTMEIEFLLLDGFSLMSVASAIEPIRAANRLLGREAYRWHLTSEDGNAVAASNGLSVNAEARLGDGKLPDLIFVCAGMTMQAQDQKRLNAALNTIARRGTRMGALSMGAIFLARAGLLNKVRCTLHWEGHPAFRDEFPDIELANALYVIDRNRYTCAGGVAGLDMMLHLITQDHGEDVARAVANQFQMDRIRGGASEQKQGKDALPSHAPKPLTSAITAMRANIETPMTVAEIAGEVGTSPRSLERVFRSHLGLSPARYYNILRLEQARELLLHSNLATVEIAIATGFNSSSYFAASFAEHFGQSPRNVRKTGALVG